MQWTDDSGRAYGEEPYGGAGYGYAYGHQGGGAVTDTAPLPWDAVHQGQIDTQPIPFMPEIPFVPEPDTPVSDPVRPVFVDSSGRRQRRALRAARLLMIPAGGYVVLLISTLLGGPSVSAPFFPQPAATHPAAPRVHAPSGTGRPAVSANPAAAHTGPRPVRKAPGTTAAPTARGTGTTVTRTQTTSPASAPTRTPAPKGRALGSSHKPVK
ncbi:hypothetical protein ACFV2N_21635 [Streptomyces sp. NPDC059680]|uniref:hypothetical protein n=1 Tax=Streptomyces sp. NPDC059680 TaxID=3346904 RepID=UPI003684992B